MNHSSIFVKKSTLISRKFIIRSLAAIGIYVAAISYIFKNEERFFFQHNKKPADSSYSFQEEYKEKNIKINEDVHLHALLFSKAKSKGIVLYFPAGSFNFNHFEARNNVFYQNGYSLLIPDYRGTGKSNSLYTHESDIYQDAQQWYKMAKRMADSSQLIIIGEEFGTGPAAWIGGEFLADLVVLKSPYYSWNEIMLKKYFWWTPHTYFSQYKIPVWEFIRKSTNRIILIHSTNSKFIKYDNSLRLLEFLKPGDELISLDLMSEPENTKLYNERISELLEASDNP